jgi:large subunit ribosomal protein L2
VIDFFLDSGSMSFFSALVIAEYEDTWSEVWFDLGAAYIGATNWNDVTSATVGDKVVSGEESPVAVGNCLPLSKIPLGMDIHSIELQPGRGAVLCRSAGVRATLAARDAGWAQINLPSGEIRRVPAKCRATIGTIGNSDHMGIVLGKAGRKRWMGRRPHVRGTAMNPVDHPHGGGEGRTKGGRHPVSPTGKPTKGGATRKRYKASNKSIVRRRRSRRYGQLKIKK